MLMLAAAAAGVMSAPVLRLQAEKKVFNRQAVADISPADAAARLVCLSEEGQVRSLEQSALVPKAFLHRTGLCIRGPSSLDI